MGRFFGTADRPVLYDQPRAITASAERLNLSRRSEERVDKRETTALQIQCWRAFSQIGEIHFAFSFVGQLVSRARLYPAIVIDPERPPIDLASFLKSMDDKGAMDNVRVVTDKANALIKELTENTPGRTSGLLRTMAMNLSIPGEVYLLHDEDKKQWLPLSSEELTTTGSKYRIRRSKNSTSTGAKKDREIDKNAFVARIWRSDPRWGDEADSSLMGVLDICEQLMLLDQMMRAMSRRAMNAGLVYIPDGISAFSADSDEETVAEAIAKSALESVERETAISSVTPKVIQGPPELGDAIKRIPLSDPISKDLAESADRLLERILAGLDIPREIVSGLAQAKFANATVVTDDLFRSHIEPLLLLIVDSLTTVYLRPLLKKGLTEAQAKIADDICCWADTSAIVTRPDHSTAASNGYDKKLISAEAWRRVHGFDETDAPDEAELLQRVLVDRGAIPQDMAVALLERMDPEFFKRTRQSSQAEAGFPEDITQMLSGEGEVPTEPSAADRATGNAGGTIVQNPLPEPAPLPR